MQIVIDFAQIRRFILFLGLATLCIHVITDPEAMAEVIRFLKTTVWLPTV